MSMNPAKLDQITETLRQTKAPSGAAERTLASVSRPHRALLSTRLCAVAAALVGLGYVLWPHEHSGIALAQIVKNTMVAKRWHRVLWAANDGRKIEEAWQDGPLMRLERHDPKGKLIWEWRYDGLRKLEYVPVGLQRERGVTLPNATYVVKVWRPSAGVLASGVPATNYDYLFSEASRRGPDEPQYVRGVDRYTFVRDHWGIRADGSSVAEAKNDHLTLDVDPTTHRIRSVKSEVLGTTETVDYPSSIPSTVFNISRHEVSGTPIHDLDIERKAISNTMHHGLGTKDGITVRLVALDFQGVLWALWTGSSVSGKDPFHPTPWRLLGVKSHRGYTMRHLTSGWSEDKAFSQDVPAVGKHLSGSAVYPREKLGKTIDLEIRADDGHYVRFSHMPIFRMTLFEDYSHEFGLKTSIIMTDPK